MCVNCNNHIIIKDFLYVRKLLWGKHGCAHTQDLKLDIPYIHTLHMPNTHMYIYTTHMYIYICTYSHIQHTYYTHVHIHTYIYIHTYIIHIRTCMSHTHTHMHTYVHKDKTNIQTDRHSTCSTYSCDTVSIKSVQCSFQ